MTVSTKRVLGIDTSLRSTGVAVVEQVGSRLICVEYGRIRISARQPVSACLVAIREGLDALIQRTAPGEVSIEGIFYCKNVKTAVLLGQARGVAIEACAVRGLPVHEYAPRRVKQSVVGFGGAGKEQVRKMVVSLLALREEPDEDAADALALAICHLHSRSRHTALAPAAI